MSTTQMMRPDAKPPTDGGWAYLSGWAAEANPFPPGTDDAARWADDHAFQARAASGTCCPRVIRGQPEIEVRGGKTG